MSGLLLVLFLVLHLGGISLAFFSPPRFEAWAATLHRQSWLPLLEIALAGLLLLHPLLSLARAWRHGGARGAVPGARVSRRTGGIEPLVARAGRWMPWSGALLLLFLGVHLLQLRLHRPAAGAELAATLAALAPPAALALYVAAGLALGLHLLHGVESGHRGLGLLEPANGGAIRAAGRALALVLGGGFALLPLALLLRGGF
jgi:succinate dehydrogenase / fumarate reductase cytochrome b subunit